MRNKVGTPVEGQDFYGRVKELSIAKRKLDEEQSLLLSAPRRVGKSSFAKKLKEDKGIDGWKCLYIDLERVTTEEGFVKEMIGSLKEGGLLKEREEGKFTSIHKLFDVIDSVSLGNFSVNLNKKEEKENLYNTITTLITHDCDSLIVVDELTLFLGILNGSENGEDKVSYILNWLRSLRQVSRTKVRWLFCGSIGLKNFAAKFNLSYAINDLYDLKLDEMPRNEAIDLLRLLRESYKLSLSDSIIDSILDKLCWNMPYFIQVMFSTILEDYDGKVISEENVNNAYNKLCSENYLSTWSERLEEYLHLETIARKILKAMARADDGLKRDTILDNIMVGASIQDKDKYEDDMNKTLSMLENDGYIMRKEDGRRIFRSPILRDYWRHTFID